MTFSTYSDYGIDLPQSAAGPEVYAICPQCSRERKKKNVKCLSVNVEKGAFCCHHCGWAGGLAQGGDKPRVLHWNKPRYMTPEPKPQIDLPQKVLDWFYLRGITDDVIRRNKIEFGRAYFPQLEDFADAILFPYFRNGQLVNLKYRTLDKLFRMEPNCERVLYGLDDIDTEEPLVWVEGEPDKLALEVAGFRNVVSVPNGAPSPDSKNYDKHFDFLDADADKIGSVTRHILAVDADAPGAKLEDELSRRLGVDKCARVRWPENVKDANECLIKFGADDLRWYIDNAEAYPIDGTFDLADLDDAIDELYDHGVQRGVETGWMKLNPLYSVRPGELTVVSGIASSGKSNWLDCLLVNIAKQYDWRFAIFSPEYLPLQQHMAAMCEKYLRKPFYAGPTARMTRAELDTAKNWTREHFTWILPKSEDDWRIENILDIGAKLCLRNGIRGLVVDPWNELENSRPAGMTETEYIGQSLKRARFFARERQIHIWIVAHPTKMQRSSDGNFPIPTLWDISSSAHWRNKADNGIIVWRDLSGEDTDEVEVHVQKIRFRQVGRRGMATLYFDKVTATYSDSPVTRSGDWYDDIDDDK